ncbi:hypothetical protein OKW12_001938 [Pseudomonas silensiensis]|nr:hypothetical protein [Pseudomonas silensiensis]
MRLAIDAEAILAAFSGQNVELEDVLRPSILAITKLIVDDYGSKINLDGSGMSKDWLNRVYSSPQRLRMVSEAELSEYSLAEPEDLECHYIGAAYYNGQHLIRDVASPSTAMKAKQFGLKLSNTSSKIDIESLCGHKIVAHFSLNSSTSYKHNILRDYFANETQVVIYDRYLKASSVCFFETVIRAAHKNVCVTIISEFDSNGNSSITKEAVQQSLKKVRPHGTINCYYPNFKEMSDKHDRHIHLNNRLQLTFSSGTDCFGLAPEWNNSECDVQVYFLSGDSAIREYPVKKEIKGGSLVIKCFSKI